MVDCTIVLSTDKNTMDCLLYGVGIPDALTYAYGCRGGYGGGGGGGG